MDTKRISYAGVGAAVAGVIGIIGIYSAWWETDTALYNGTADISGTLALAMAVGLFAFGAAYVLLSDSGIRRALGALVIICAFLLTIACVWGISRTGDVAASATVSAGLAVSLLGGILGVAAGFLVLRDNAEADAGPAPAQQDAREDEVTV
jgi:hypothetical protein